MRISLSFSEGTLSPVSADSSALSAAASSIRQSAGTLSPASRAITSPGTSSELGITIISPERYTLLCAALIACRASMADSALFSWYTPRTALAKTTNRIINTSASSLPSEIIPVIADITAAAISTSIIGFLNCSMNLASRVGLGGSSSLF